MDKQKLSSQHFVGIRCLFTISVDYGMLSLIYFRGLVQQHRAEFFHKCENYPTYK